jgi:hypothetical protein
MRIGLACQAAAEASGAADEESVVSVATAPSGAASAIDVTNIAWVKRLFMLIFLDRRR